MGLCVCSYSSSSLWKKKSGWVLNEARFESLTLMVGVSGVGKTKVLDAIVTLRDMVCGKSYNGIKWRAVFLDANQSEIVWEGETEETKDFFDLRQAPFCSLFEEEEPEFTFLRETVHINNEEIFRRSDSGAFYKGTPIVKLQKTKSLLHLLQEEDVIGLREKISRIYKKEHRIGPVNKNVISKYSKLKTVESIIGEDSLSLSMKLFLISEEQPSLFEKIKADFLEIFPFVEDIKFSTPDFLCCASYNPVPEMQVLQLKEKKSDLWVCIWDFSSGMHKTIGLLSAIYLTLKGSIFLVDEFENTFGVNCIDAIASKILSSSPENQFILTSHHPYIINKIPVESWRIVTRRGNTVDVGEAIDAHSSCSRHDAFIQLINCDQYSEGVTS